MLNYQGTCEQTKVSSLQATSTHETSTSELIHIQERDGQRAVSARELHQVLGSKQDFSTWIKNRINKYGFIENQDYQSFHNSVEREIGASTRIEYALSIDMAKEIAMVEGNERGRKVRQYFIECEKKLSNPAKQLTKMQLAQMVIESEMEKERLALENEQIKSMNERLEYANEKQSEELKLQAPKVKYHDEVLTSTSTYNTTNIAKEFGMGAPSLNKILHEKGVQYKSGGQWLLYSKYQDRGYTRTVTNTYDNGHGEVHTRQQTVWTEKGRQFIHSLLTPKCIAV
jgi:anti-repressor protein